VGKWAAQANLFCFVSRPCIFQIGRSDIFILFFIGAQFLAPSSFSVPSTKVELGSVQEVPFIFLSVILTHFFHLFRSYFLFVLVHTFAHFIFFITIFHYQHMCSLFFLYFYKVSYVVFYYAEEICILC
jgi:hypothetical protein